MARGRGVRTHECRAADPGSGQSRACPRTECRDSGQSEREDDRKRGVRGYDGGKKVNGRKRHILVDTGGLLLRVVVHAADIADRDGARFLLAEAAAACPRLQHLWVDAGYQGPCVTWIEATLGWQVAVVRKPRRWGWYPAGVAPPPLPVGFQVLPRRWVVERTFGWLGRNRRLSKDYELLPATGEAWINLAMSHLMARRLAA